MALSPDAHRVAPLLFDANGKPRHQWTTTPATLQGLVNLPLPPDEVLPVIFVPGIMGSNLKSIPSKSGEKSKSVWRLDSGIGGKPSGLLFGKLSDGPGIRQKELHPDRTKVDNGGAVPSKPAGEVQGDAAHCRAVYRQRGWGEVGEASYSEFLLWLEETLNGQGFNPALWPQFWYESIGPARKPGEPAPEPRLHPGIYMHMHGLPSGSEKNRFPSVISSDLLARARYRMPVHACGYNWLDDNQNAANALAIRIFEVIKQYPKCKQVILVTHSMGGLVARACAKLGRMTFFRNGQSVGTLDMAKAIAGVVHGVMPALGAAVAYRRCKIGMADEDLLAGLVIGSSGREVTAVFAQAPGALQLLPTVEYTRGWLRVCDETGRVVLQPMGDPYDDIYGRKDRWWDLVRPEWLKPVGGQQITWQTYLGNVDKAKEFHKGICGHYHDCTYTFYGADSDQPSFENVTWRMKKGRVPDRKLPPNAVTVSELGFDRVRDNGSSPLHVGGDTLTLPLGDLVVPGAGTYETSYWELHCDKQDGIGDGTVPQSSGAAPKQHSNVREQFRLTGIEHEPAYKHDDAKHVTLFALMKIAAQASNA